MDLQKIKALIDLLAESPLARLEVIEGEERVKLVKAKRRGKRQCAPAGEQRIATMSASGLSLLRSLAILEEQSLNQKLSATVRDVRRDVESGLSLSGAMQKRDKIFPRLMISMIAAGVSWSPNRLSARARWACDCRCASWSQNFRAWACQ